MLSQGRKNFPSLDKLRLFPRNLRGEKEPRSPQESPRTAPALFSPRPKSRLKGAWRSRSGDTERSKQTGQNKAHGLGRPCACLFSSLTRGILLFAFFGRRIFPNTQTPSQKGCLPPEAASGGHTFSRVTFRIHLPLLMRMVEISTLTGESIFIMR